jgi:hypothetical protein
MREPRGAGRGGGLLFLAVVLFVAYLALQAITGLLQIVLGAVLLVVLAAFTINVLRRG